MIQDFAEICQKPVQKVTTDLNMALSNLSNSVLNRMSYTHSYSFMSFSIPFTLRLRGGSLFLCK